MNQKHSDIHYCSLCRMTTTHAVSGNMRTCNRCGSVKTTDGARTKQTDSQKSEHCSVAGCRWN